MRANIFLSSLALPFYKRCPERGKCFMYIPWVMGSISRLQKELHFTELFQLGWDHVRICIDTCKI